jgi:D-2-hydroxyacid dehydrogenase (NADP+)
MRETAVHLMLSVARPSAAMQKDRAGHVWQRRLWTLLDGKTAMVAGVGVAGIAIGRALNGLGMTVIGLSRTTRDIDGFAAVEPIDKLTEVVHRADYLVSVLPGDAHNNDRINAAVFAAMKPSAYFINVGRGETVVEPDLIAALQSGTIAGAGLDVFRKEPLPADSPFWDMDNVVMTPHVGGYFVEYEDYVMPIIIDNMRCFLDGRIGEMQNVVKR